MPLFLQPSFLIPHHTEAFANVIVAGTALLIFGRQKGLPLKLFIPAGCSQVLAKACTSLALANALSFPVVTLAKSGKMVPVMIGSIILGGTKYTMKEYLTVAAIIVGTVIVTIDSKKSGGSQKSDSIWGVIFILSSLFFDGVVGGMQNRLKKATKATIGKDIKPYDMMFWTNLTMGVTALVIILLPFNDLSGTMGTPEISRGLAYVMANPAILNKILMFSVASAVGQSFIFYTISNFDSLTCTTVTTTRKVMSTLLSIFTEGHSMSSTGWGGILLASGGIGMEIVDKMGHKKPPISKTK